MAAHLPGMCAAIFPMPVIGIPMHTTSLGGRDSLYSIVQMPSCLLYTSLQEYLLRHPADVIITPHLYPAEIITNMKKMGMEVPPSIFVATDYACIPVSYTHLDVYKRQRLLMGHGGRPGGL